MNYLSPEERRVVNAVSNWPRRPLNAVETAVRNISNLVIGYRGIGTIAVGRAEAIKQVIADLDAATSNYQVRELARAAIDDDGKLKELIGKYPHVEFHDVLNNPPVDGIMGLALSGVKETSIVSALEWLRDFRKVVFQLPDYGHAYHVHTPNTPHNVLRNAAINDGFEAGFGIALRKDLQDEINRLFHVKHQNDLYLIEQHQLYLLSVDEVLHRFGIGLPIKVTPCREKTFTVTMTFSRSAYVGRANVPVLSVSATSYPLLDVGDVGQLYHFAL
jgi:hypothetical protein